MLILIKPISNNLAIRCARGWEFEYRHNEMARLNPRDCWYWKHGNCLNPACGFRHPNLFDGVEGPVEPLDVNNEVLVGAASFSHFSSVPPSKHKVPCYFYFSGYCNKGDRCTFLHDPDYSSSVKTKLYGETTDPPASDAKTTVKTEPSLLPYEGFTIIIWRCMPRPGATCLISEPGDAKGF
ncbi:Zinc finger CCCH domain-containing protein [Drosera capensis]